MDSRTPATVNEVQSFPLDESHGINEISSYRNNNSNNYGKNNYSGKPWQQKNDGKPWQNRDNKQWQNKDNKPWQNKDKKSWQNDKGKEDKPRNTCFTLSRKIKNSLFQQIVMRTCSRSSAPWSKHKLTKHNIQVAMGKRLMK